MQMNGLTSNSSALN